MDSDNLFILSVCFWLQNGTSYYSKSRRSSTSLQSSYSYSEHHIACYLHLLSFLFLLFSLFTQISEELAATSLSWTRMKRYRSLVVGLITSPMSHSTFCLPIPPWYTQMCIGFQSSSVWVSYGSNGKNQISQYRMYRILLH